MQPPINSPERSSYIPRDVQSNSDINELDNASIPEANQTAPSPLSLALMLMKEKLKNIPIWPMAITVIGSCLLGFAFMSGVPFSLPLLVSGAIVMGLGIAWLLSSQIAKSLGIGACPNGSSSQKKEGQGNEVHEENNEVQENNRAQSHSEDDAARNENENENRNQQQENNQKTQTQRARRISSVIRFNSRETEEMKKIKSAKTDEDLPKRARENLAFDGSYDDIYEEEDFFKEG